MADVNGDLVIPVKKLTIPASISMLALLPSMLNQPAITDPTLAPAARAGANTPPAAPTQKDRMVPANLKTGKYQATILLSENNVLVMISLPEPAASGVKKKLKADIVTAAANR